MPDVNETCPACDTVHVSNDGHRRPVDVFRCRKCYAFIASESVDGKTISACRAATEVEILRHDLADALRYVDDYKHLLDRFTRFEDKKNKGTLPPYPEPAIHATERQTVLEKAKAFQFRWPGYTINACVGWDLYGLGWVVDIHIWPKLSDKPASYIAVLAQASPTTAVMKAEELIEKWTIDEKRAADERASRP